MNPAIEEAAILRKQKFHSREFQSRAGTWPRTHKLMVMKRKLQLESPMSRAVAKAGSERKRGGGDRETALTVVLHGGQTGTDWPQEKI